ncbi:hypothetical protein SLS63_009660 [Diaporthe eres]|uniref:Uncharacterized protein n=1 Tax=Diaporthe eres TaxID=83184 RepID=A0ABR1NZ72_DIAER
MNLRYINVANVRSTQTFFFPYFTLAKVSGETLPLKEASTNNQDQNSVAYQPRSRATMDNPEVTYATHEQWLAIHGEDTKIYPYLPGYSHAQLIRDDIDRVHREKSCSFYYLRPYVPPSPETYDQRPETIPFTRDDLQAFRDNGLDSVHGYWSVHWAAETPGRDGDIIYDDGYRSVMTFRSIEFMIRPVADFRNRADAVAEPLRLYIGWRDLRECLDQALQQTGPMRTFIGVAYMNQPRRGQEDVPEGKREIAIDWRIDRAHPDRMTWLVEKWKHHKAFKNTQAYYDKLKEVEAHAAREEYNQQFQPQDPAATQPGRLFGVYVPPVQPPEPVPERRRIRSGPRRKRTSKAMGASQELSRGGTDMSASQELGPSRKRRNVGSHSSRSSQSASASQSVTSSPEMRRQTPVDSWQRTQMPPPQSPRSAQPSYSDQGYGSRLPAAPPRQGQPYATAPMQHVPAPGSGFGRGQPGGAPNPYWPQASPVPGPYSAGTVNYSPSMASETWGRGNYAPSPQIPSPTMAAPGGDVFRYRVSTASSPGGPSYATGSSYQTPSMVAPGRDLFRYQVPTASPPGGPGYAAVQSYQRPAMAAPGGNVAPNQVPPASSDPYWFGSAGLYMQSTDPQDWDQSGYQDQSGGGRGSGRR